MAVPLSEFEPVLAAFLGLDNAARMAAHNYLNTLRTGQPDTLLLSLLQALRTSQQAKFRSLAAVLIRKALFTDDEHIWSKMSKSVQDVVKSELLAAIPLETEEEIRRMVCDTVGEVGQMILGESEWPDLLTNMFNWVISENLVLRVAALSIFHALALYLAERMVPQFSTFVNIFQRCLVDAKSPNKVKVATLKACGAIVVCISNVLDTQPFQPLTPLMLALLTSLIQSNDEAGAHQVVSILIDMADDHPQFFKKHIPAVLTAMLNVASTKRIAVPIRQLAAEFCVTLAEKSPTALRKLPDNAFLKQTLPVLFGFMLEQSDDLARWDSKDDPVNRPCTQFNVGREAIQRIGYGLGNKTFLPIAFPIVGSFLKNSGWQYKHAALMALAEFVEMVPQEIDQLKKLVTTILPFVHDPDPRVQYGALTAIGMISMDHQPVVQLHCHEGIIPAIRFAMTSKSQRVRAHAAGALVNFLEGAFDGLMAPYVDGLLGDLFTLLTTGPTLVTENAMNALAVLVDTCLEVFGEKYDRLMPVLKDFVTRCTDDKKLRKVRGRAIECIGILGASVTADKFRPDAVQVMHLMSTELARDMDADDPQRSAMWTTWGRIAKALGSQFAQYLPRVMPAMLKAAAEDPVVTTVSQKEAAEIAAAEADDSELDSDADDMATFVGAGQGSGVMLRVRTSAVEDKTEAIRVLSNFALGLGAAFYSHVPDLARAILPTLELQGEVYDDVKAAALSCLPPMLTSTNDATTGAARAAIKSLLEMLLNAVMAAMAKVEDMELAITFIQCIKHCTESACRAPDTEETRKAAASAGVASLPVFTPIMSTQQLDMVVTQVMVVMQESLNRRARMHAEMTVDAEDYDEYELERVEMEQATEHELQYHCLDCLSSLFKTHGPLMMPVFDAKLVEKVTQMCDPVCLPVDRKHGVFLIDDVLEFCGQGAVKHLATFIPILVACSDSSEVGLAQAAVYGLGVAATTMGEAFKPYVAESMKALGKVVSKEAAEELQQKVRDNAVSAIGKILLCQPSDRLGELVTFWLQQQPLTVDEDESRVVTRQLCTRIESNCPYTLSTANLPKVLHTIAFIVASKELCTQALAVQLRSALSHLKSVVDGSTLGSVWGGLPADVQKALSLFLADTRVAAPASPVVASPAAVGSPYSGAGAGTPQ